jgi:hypothetical protein
MVYLSGSILTGGLPDCKSSQSAMQFCPVDLGPGLNEAQLCLGKTAAQALDSVHGEHRRLILIVRMKCGRWCGPPASTNIRITIPKKRESSGTLAL